MNKALAPQQDPRLLLTENLRLQRIPGLDGIRAFAALSVIVFHDQLFVHGYASRFSFPGRFSVQVFFVVSGLLITWLLLGEQTRTGTVNRTAFYWRRAFRLLPALLAVLLWNELTRLPAVSRGGVFATAFYFANYYAIFSHSGTLAGLGQMWSLSVEEHFYLIWPQLFLFIRDRKRLLRICLVIIALQVAWRLLAGLRGAFIYAELSTETASAAALAGCALALILWSQPQRLPRFLLAPWLAPVSLAAIVALAQLPRPMQLWWAVPAGIPFAAILVLQAVCHRWRILENPVVAYLGRISYGIYLWGIVAIEVAHRYTSDWRHLPALALAVAFASVSYFLIERPIQSFGRLWLSTRAAAQMPLESI